MTPTTRDTLATLLITGLSIFTQTYKNVKTFLHFSFVQFFFSNFVSPMGNRHGGEAAYENSGSNQLGTFFCQRSYRINNFKKVTFLVTFYQGQVGLA